MSSKHLNAQYNLRLPEDLKAKIEASAKAHNRSMNADIVARLEASFAPNQMDELIHTVSGAEAMEILRGIREMLIKERGGAG